MRVVSLNTQVALGLVIFISALQPLIMYEKYTELSSVVENPTEHDVPRIHEKQRLRTSVKHELSDIDSDRVTAANVGGNKAITNSDLKSNVEDIRGKEEVGTVAVHSAETHPTAESERQETTVVIATTAEKEEMVETVAELGNGVTYEREWPYPLQCKFERPPSGTENRYEIGLFYHVGMVGNWKSIVMDQLHTLELCGLGTMASSLTISYSNPAQTGNVELIEILNFYHFTTTLRLSWIESNVEPWEKEAISSISNHCHQRKDKPAEEVRIGQEEEKVQVDKKRFVYYFHNKGSSRHSSDWRKRDCRNLSYCFSMNWRKYMEWFLLEKPTLCLRAMLNHEASTCGINVQVHPMLHYSGNFWAASCDYIVSSLGSTVPFGNTAGFLKYVAAEMWIGEGMSNNTAKHVSFIELWDHKLDYNEIWPTSWALGLFKNISIDTFDTGKYPDIWSEYLAAV